MRIRALQLNSFGKYRNQRFDFSTVQINLIVGRNESGKTTLFEALKASVSGFLPANREQYPYVPWDEEEVNLSLHLEDGSLLHRRMRSGISGTLERDGVVEKIKNAPLFDLDRKLIENLYTLDAEGLQDIERRNLEMVFREMLTTLDMQGVKDPREAIQWIEEKGKDLYTSRGSTRKIPQLDQRLQEATARLKEAEDDALAFRHDRKTIEEEDQRLQKLTAEEEELSQRESLLLRKKQLHQQQEDMQKVMQEIQEPTLAAKLGDSFREHLEQCIQERHVLKDAVMRESVRLKEQQTKLRERSSIEVKFLGERDSYMSQMRGLQDESLQAQSYQTSLEDECQSLENRFQENESKVFEGDLGIKQREFPPRSEITSPPLSKLFLLWTLLLVAGALQWLTQIVPPLIALSQMGLGLLLLVVEAVRFYLARRHYKAYLQRYQLLSDHQQAQLDMLRSLQGSYLEKHKLLEERNRELENLESVLNTMLSRYGLQSIDELNQFENQVILKDQQIRETEKNILAASQQLKDLKEQLEGKRLVCAQAVEQLRPYCEDEKEAFRRFQEDLKKLALYDHLKEKWEKGREDLPQGDYREEELEQLQKRKKAVKEEREAALTKRSMALQRTQLFEKIKPLQEMQSDVKQIQDERQEALYQYNLYRLLQVYLEGKYRRFMQEHQPKLMERASYWLKQLTAGHYLALLSLEDDSFYLKNAKGEILPLRESYSKGTRSQIYLALRLALIEAVEQDQKMPMFFDEAFINWDQFRLRETVSALEEISASRQIFIFSCHERLASDIASRVPVHLLRMELA